MIEILDRQEIVSGTSSAERDLRDLFGLLVHAHHRTTPGDLRRLIDAPNLTLHVARVGPAQRIAAACVVAREGGLPAELAAEMTHGRVRVQAHALADALVTHLGEVAAGSFTMARSVRIATHPDLRRRGLARALVEHVHAFHDVELFGTLFGASVDLIAFRAALGYETVRISASRNQRTGEPSVMMLRPTSARAEALVSRLRVRLARDLERQLGLLEGDGLQLEPGLADALRRDLPAAPPWSAAEIASRVREYAVGPCTFESAAAAIRLFLEQADLATLPQVERAVLEARALDNTSWDEAARRAGLAHAGLAMKAARRAVRRLVASASSDQSAAGQGASASTASARATEPL